MFVLSLRRITLSTGLILGAMVANAATNLSIDWTVSDSQLQSFLQFERINFVTVKVNGPEIDGCHFEFHVRKIQKGKVTLAKKMFDSSELGDDYKVKGPELKYRMLTKTEQGPRLKASFEFERFSFPFTTSATKSQYDYTLKDFLCGKPTAEIKPFQENYFAAYLLPHDQGNGIASYCEVAQADVPPLELGKKFDIPCYFLFSIKFKK